jgi:hypothetical protein
VTASICLNFLLRKPLGLRKFHRLAQASERYKKSPTLSRAFLFEKMQYYGVTLKLRQSCFEKWLRLPDLRQSTPYHR